MCSPLLQIQCISTIVCHTPPHPSCKSSYCEVLLSDIVALEGYVQLLLVILIFTCCLVLQSVAAVCSQWPTRSSLVCNVSFCINYAFSKNVYLFVHVERMLTGDQIPFFFFLGGGQS